MAAAPAYWRMMQGAETSQRGRLSGERSASVPRQGEEGGDDAPATHAVVVLPGGEGDGNLGEREPAEEHAGEVNLRGGEDGASEIGGAAGFEREKKSGREEKRPGHPEDEVLAVELDEGELAGVGGIAGVERGADLLVDEVGGEEAGKLRGHVDIPWGEDEEENRRAAQAEHGLEPGAEAGDEDGGEQDGAEGPEGAVDAFAHGAEGEEGPEGEVPAVAGEAIREEARLFEFGPRLEAGLDEAPDGERDEAGKEGLGLDQVVEDPDADHGGEHRGGGETEAFTAEAAGDEVGGENPADGGERVGQAQGKFVLAKDGGGDEHGPVDQRRLLHAGEAVDRGDEPVAAGVHFADGAGVEAFVVIEDDGGEADADVDQRDEAEGRCRRDGWRAAR